ncbi:hypothetical protein QZH41_018128 [Actinostola sp. cb2023]|nr:hypothetical protein QZH41_018128 [Actinostola sp. cb2023]
MSSLPARRIETELVRHSLMASKQRGGRTLRRNNSEIDQTCQTRINRLEKGRGGLLIPDQNNTTYSNWHLSCRATKGKESVR